MPSATTTADGKYLPPPPLSFGGVINMRLDPFERMQYPKGNMGFYRLFPDFFVHEFWRFVFLQQKVAEFATTFIDYPPMQEGAELQSRGGPPEVQPGRALNRWSLST